MHHLAVVLDGIETPPGGRAYVEWDDGDATIEVEQHFPELGHIAVVSTPLAVLRIQAVQPLTDPVTGFNRAHLVSELHQSGSSHSWNWT